MNPNPPTNSSDLPKRGPGRPKGVPNKFTGDLRAAILAATDSYENEEGRKGTLEWLISMREAYPKTFLQLMGRLIPQITTITGDSSLPAIRVVFEQPKSSDDSNDRS